MKVQEFRDMIDALRQWITDFKGCVGNERGAGAVRVQQSRSELLKAEWPKRLNDRDRQRALAMIAEANELLATTESE